MHNLNILTLYVYNHNLLYKQLSANTSILIIIYMFEFKY